MAPSWRDLWTAREQAAQDLYKKGLEARPELREWANTQERLDELAQKARDKVNEDPQFAPIARMEQRPLLARALNDPLLDAEEKETILDTWWESQPDPEEADTAGNRLKQNFKDAFFGIEGPGTVMGYLAEGAPLEPKRLEQWQKRQVEERAKPLARQKLEKELRGFYTEMLQQESQPEWLQGKTVDEVMQTEFVQGELEKAGPATELPEDYDPKAVDLSEYPGREQYVKEAMDWYPRLAKRDAEFAGLPEWDGPVSGALALTGQLAGSLPTPENVLGAGTGKVGGTILKQFAKRAGRQALENVAMNLATEPIVQQAAIDKGVQESFSGADAAMRSALAAGLALPMQGIGTLSGHALRKLAPGTEAGPTPRFAPEVETPLPKPEPARARAETPSPPPETPPERLTDTPPEGQKMRGFSERMQEDPREDARAIKEDPESYYSPQVLAEEKERLYEADDATLERVLMQPEYAQNVSQLAGVILRDRLLGRGEDASRVRNVLAQRGTTFGQLIRQMAEAKTTPGNVVSVVEETAGDRGLVLTPDQRKKLFSLAEAQQKARASRDAAWKQARENYSDAAQARVDATNKEFAKTVRAVQEYSHTLVPEETLRTLETVLQGNLLTPLSIVKNVWGNLAYTPVRAGRDLIAGTLDALFSQATGRPRTVFTPFTGSGQAMRGALEGLRSAGQALLTGASDQSLIKGEIQRGFRPLRSLAQAITGRDLAVDPKTGKARLSDRGRRLVEGVLGAPPEVFFRLLKLGDDPFRIAGERATRAQEARRMGHKPGTLEYAREVGVPSVRTQAKATEAGGRVVFAQENKLSKWLMAGDQMLRQVPVVGPTLGFLGRVIVPFRQFPVNYITTALDVVAPPVALTKALYHGAQAAKGLEGGRQRSLENVGKAAMGGMMWTAADYLWDQGLITPPIDWKDRKQRDLQYEFAQKGRPPASLNVTGLERMVQGGSPTAQEGDRYVNLEYMGIPGMVFFMKGMQERGMVRREAAGKAGASKTLEALRTFPDMANFMMDQTFLAGVGGLTEALQDWDRFGDRWLQNVFRAVSSIPAPNSLEAVNRARWEYIPELEGATQWETFANIWNFKTMQAAPGDYPAKVGLFGEPVKRTPEGRNRWTYNLLDPTKSATLREDPKLGLIHNIWRQTGETAAIPSLPDNRISFAGQEYELTTEQTARLRTIVGQMRGQALDAQAKANPRPNQAQSTALLPVLRGIYSMTSAVGTLRLVAEEGGFQALTPAPEKQQPTGSDPYATEAAPAEVPPEPVPAQ